MYDYVFITHIPAFYKVNLYNELSKRLNIFVIFISSGVAYRTKDFCFKDMYFNYELLSIGNIEARSRLKSIYKLIRILKKLSYKKLIVNGWDYVEFWVAIFISPPFKNCLALESTIVESNISGLKYYIKRIFLLRIKSISSPGLPHNKLLDKLKYLGNIHVTGGVGLINKDSLLKQKIIVPFPKKYLFVGRLIKEKNLIFLVKIFNKFPDLSLTIVGSGPLEKSIKLHAKNNTIFVPHIIHEEIGRIYVEHDVFILPSISETWGLVVEEALYCGLPVLVSEHCGVYEIVKQNMLGLTFNPYSKESFERAMRCISNPEMYLSLKKNVLEFDFEEKDNKQVMGYCKLVRK